jgi:endonuclease-3
MVPLYRKYKTPEDIASADPSVLEKELSSINFYRNKTKALIACSKDIVEKFKGIVPNTIEDLTSLPGVGRKTANVVLGNCFNVPAIMTDTHLNRVSQRLNLVDSDKPDIIEMQLKEIIPAELQTKYSHIAGEHGRLICKARSPVCNECVINLFCPSKGVFT